MFPYSYSYSLHSDMLSNPSGNDLQELTYIYIRFTWKSTNRMLNVVAPDTQLEMEEEKCSKAEDIGSAWIGSELR